MILLGLLACAVVVRLWAMPLASSLWLDEFGTAWVTGGSLGEAFERARLFPQSLPYAAIVWATRRVFGSSEIALRAPSLVAMLAATYLLYRLGRKLFDREAGLLGTGVFLLFPQIEFAAGDARPYAFAVLATVASLLALVHWMDEGRPVDGAAWVFLAAAAVYFQYLFAAVLVAQAAYALLRWRRRSPVLGRHLALAGAGLALLLAPAGVLAFEVGVERARHAYGGLPGVKELVRSVVPERVLGVLLPGLLLAVVFRLARLSRPRLDEGRRNAAWLLWSRTTSWESGGKPSASISVGSRPRLL